MLSVLGEQPEGLNSKLQVCGAIQKVAPDLPALNCGLRTIAEEIGCRKDREDRWL